MFYFCQVFMKKIKKIQEKGLKMPRKNLKILNEKISNDYKLEQIIRIENLYTVLYENNIFSIKLSNKLVDYPGPKYKKMIFFSKNQAVKMAKKLNEKFKTDKFHAVKVLNFDKI